MKYNNLFLISISFLFGCLVFMFLYVKKTKKENFIPQKSQEDVQSILNTDGLSYSDKISKIKSLKIKDDTLNDLIFKNEKITLDLIKEYMKTSIPTQG
jgi:heme/copper-type cytochrome/quinol oxidase subunit 3